MPKKKTKPKKKPRKSIETHAEGKASIYSLYDGKRWYSGLTQKGMHLVFTKSEMIRARKRGKRIWK